uniref:Transglycosylase SLT domain-containing protein n=1 Tax=uncultured marine virus TaxID=186617 RepID=A0A0F7L447_9VIRU|nr:hypothetical protein [uncultured marine virus]
MVDRIADKNLTDSGNRIQLTGSVPAQLANDVSSNAQNTNQLFAGAIKGLKRKEEVKLSRKGIIDGQNNTLDPGLLFKDTYRGRAYTDSALTNYVNSVELQTRKQIQTILAENPNDHKAAGAKIEGFINGMVDGMPEEIQERMGPNYRLQAQITASPGLSQIRTNQNSLLIAQQQAEAVENDSLIAKSIPVNAQGLFSDDTQFKNESTLAILNDRNAIEGRYNSKILGEDGEEIAAFDPVKGQGVLALFDKDTSISAIKSQFHGMKDKKEYLREFRTGKLDESFIVRDDEGTVLMDLRPKRATREALDSHMVGVIKREDTILKGRRTAITAKTTQAVQTVKAGGNIPPEHWTELRQGAAAAKSPGEMARIDEWQNYAAHFEKLKLLNPATLQGELKAVDKEILRKKQDGELVSSATMERRNGVDSLLSKMKTALKTDPIEWGNHVGVIEMGPVVFDPRPEIEINGQTLSPGAMMQKRVEDAIHVSDYYGTPLTFLTAQDAAIFDKVLDNPEATGGDILGAIASTNGFGEYQDNVLGEIAEKQPAMGQIAGLMNAGATATTLGDAADGLIAMKNGAKVIPATSTTNLTTTDTLGAAFQTSPGTRNAVIATARGIYTTRATRMGLDTENFNDDLWKRSLIEASGGIFKNDIQLGGPADFGGGGIFSSGNKVIAPSGFPAEDFEATIRGFSQSDFKAGAINGIGRRVRPPQSENDTTQVTETINLKDLLSDDDEVTLITIDDGKYLLGKPDGVGGVDYVRGRTDPTSDIPAIRAGFYVLDFRKALSHKSARGDNPGDLTEFPKLTKKVIGKTPGGRNIYENEIDKQGFTSESSERAIHIEHEGKHYTFPSIFDGVELSIEEATKKAIESKFIDSETGRKSPAFDTATEAIEAGKERSKGLSKHLHPETAGNGFQSSMDKLEALAIDIGESLESGLDTAAEFLNSPAPDLSEAGEVLDNVTEKAGELVDDTKEAIKPALKKGKAALESAGDTLEKGIDKAAEFLNSPAPDFSQVQEKISNIAEEVRGGIKTLKEFAEENAPDIPEFFKSIPRKLKNSAARHRVEGFIDSIKDLVTDPETMKGLPPIKKVMSAIAMVESSGGKNLLSSKGAMGIVQIMPATAQDIADNSNLGFTKDEILNDQSINLMAGQWYLTEWLLPKFNGEDRLSFAIAAYHGGIGNIQAAREKAANISGNAQSVDDFKAVFEHLGPKTKNYVRKVTREINR